MDREYQARIETIDHVTEDVVLICCRLVKPPKIDFRAGQFVMIKFPNPEGEDVSRLYSVASNPLENDILEFYIKIVPGGKGTSLIKYLQVGQEIKVIGPNGVFYLHDDDPHRELVMIANGVGIVPFRSMLRFMREKGDERRVQLLWGLRFATDIFMEEELRELPVDYEILLSQPDEKWKGTVGRVTDYLEQTDFTVVKKSFYLCGSKGMILDVTKILQDKGVAPEHIYFEKFY